MSDKNFVDFAAEKKKEDEQNVKGIVKLTLFKSLDVGLGFSGGITVQDLTYLGVVVLDKAMENLEKEDKSAYLKQLFETMLQEKE